MAAAGDPIQGLRDEATCSICLQYFTDPVIIPGCGHNFCRSCLIQCRGARGGQVCCPHCRTKYQRSKLISNRQLENIIELIKNLSKVGGAEERRRGECEEHQESRKLFCKEDEAPICMLCDRSNEHENHNVIHLKEGEISRCLEILRKEKEENLAYQAQLVKGSKDLLKLTETESLKAVEKVRQLCQFLEEQKKFLLLNYVKEVEKEIAGRRDELLTRLSWKLSFIESIMKEMEKCQLPASELLQDMRSTLQRYEESYESSENPLLFLPELKDRILESCDLNHLMKDTMKQWKDALLFRKQIQKENVTLDPDTAHPMLILSEDRKSVRCGHRHQDLPDNPERFSHQNCVLGREGFTAGRHFWEVNVGSEEGWVLGVARKSVQRKSCFSFRSERGIWTLGKGGGKYWLSTSHPNFSLRWEPRRIRVTLDYEGECVSFSDADSGAELYTFSGALFSTETLLPFFYLWVCKTHLTIS